MFGTVDRTHRFTESYFQYKRTKKLTHDRTVPEVFVRIGPPGTGKTKRMDDTYRFSVFNVIKLEKVNRVYYESIKRGLNKRLI